MSTATFTVPLTARVLRAILADIEGVDTLMSKCGCHAEVPDAPDAGGLDAAIAKYDPCFNTPEARGELTNRQVEPMTSEDYVDAAEILTSGATAAPIVLDAKSLAMRDLCDNIVAPLTSGIVEEGNPFAAINASISAVVETIDTAAVNAYTEMVTPAQTTLGLGVPTPPALVVPPVPPTGTVPLDSEGLPWDKRIHASTRTRRVGDDTWKLMKGVDKVLVEQVKAELRATMAANGPLNPPVPPAVVPHLSGSWTPETGHVVGIPVPPVTIHPAFAEPTNYSGAQSGGYAPTVTAPPAPLVPAPPAHVATPQPPMVPVAPTAPGAPTTFSDFVTYATNKIVGKQFSRDQLQAACANEGITSMPMLENRPDLIPAIWKFLESISIPASSVGGE